MGLHVVIACCSSLKGPALVVCDRGAMDGKAYCSDETWEAILTQMGVDVVQLRDRQYDAVYHLVTAAVGAEEFYGSDTNAARRETVEEARALDSKTLNTYLGHPHLRSPNRSWSQPCPCLRALDEPLLPNGTTHTHIGTCALHVDGPSQNIPPAAPPPESLIFLFVGSLHVSCLDLMPLYF